MVIGASLEGERKTLSDTAEIDNSKKKHKSGLELWRVLKYNFDRVSALNARSILESIRSMEAAKNVQDVMPKLNTLGRRHQEYGTHAVASKE